MLKRIEGENKILGIATLICMSEVCIFPSRPVLLGKLARKNRQGSLALHGSSCAMAAPLGLTLGTRVGNRFTGVSMPSTVYSCVY